MRSRGFCAGLGCRMFRALQYRGLPLPLLSFLDSYNRHFSSLDSVVTQTHEGFLYKVQTAFTFYQYSTCDDAQWYTCRRPGAGRNSEPGPQSLQLASEAQLHVSARILAEEAGIAGRSRRSRCRKKGAPAKTYRVARALFSRGRLISEASLPVFQRGWGRIGCECVRKHSKSSQVKSIHVPRVPSESRLPPVSFYRGGQTD